MVQPANKRLVTEDKFTKSLTALTDSWGNITVADDGTSTASWPDRFTINYDPVTGTTVQPLTWNEYGETRLQPAKSNTVALRIFAGLDATLSAARSTSVGLFEIQDNRADRNIKLSIFSNGNITTVGAIAATGKVTGANLPTNVTYSTSAPSSPILGDHWVDQTT
jgi:hypothetical protein